MSERRRSWTGEQIMAMLKRHFVGKEDISKICQEEDIQPSQFYRWQAMLFDDGAAVFVRKNGHAEQRELEAERAKAAALEAKLQKKNEVLSELMEEHVRLKKELGES